MRHPDLVDLCAILFLIAGLWLAFTVLRVGWRVFGILFMGGEV